MYLGCLLAISALILCIQADYGFEEIEFHSIFMDEVIMGRLSNLVNKSRELLQAGLHSGSLIAAGLNTTFTEGSDEERALHILHNDMNRQFGHQALDSYESMSKLDDVLFDIGYDGIRKNLSKLHEQFNLVTNPNITRQGLKDDFIKSCTLTWNPGSVLDYLDKIYRVNCPFPTKEHVLHYVRANEAFRSVYAISSFVPWYSSDSSMKRNILSSFNILNRTEAEAVILKLETTPGFTEEALTELLDSTTSKEKEKKCILALASYGEGHLREVLLAAAQLLTIDMLHIKIYTTTCANVSTSGNETAIQRILETTANKIEAIGNHTLEWIQRMNNLTWPEVSMQAARAAFDFGTERIPIHEFGEVAEKVKGEIYKRQPEMDTFQVLVVRTGEKDVYWSVANESASYGSFLDFHGVDCHAFKLARDVSGREEKATDLFEKKRAALQTVLKDNAFTRNTSTVLSLLTEIAPLLDKDLYRSALLLREEAILARSTYIKAGESFRHSTYYSPSSIEYYVNDSLGAYAWKYYLFF